MLASPAGVRGYVLRLVAIAGVVAMFGLGGGAAIAQTGASASRAGAIVGIARRAMAADHLKAVIVRVTVDGRPVVTRALGESVTGVPATTRMHFRNGAVAFSYVSTLLMRLVDEHRVKLGDKISRWLPKLPDAKLVTLKMLANMTSGYPDYETDSKFLDAFNMNPFHLFTYPERLAIAFSRHVLFKPGSNWSYAHTNYMILGKILGIIGHRPLSVLLRKQVLRPLGLRNTIASQSSAIPSPVLHSFSSERRKALGIPAGKPFYEESTYWNSSWGTPVGATETTNIYDMTTTANGIGSGKLLSKASYRTQTGPHLLGFGRTEDNCKPSCFKQVNGYNYGLGIVRSGHWLLQNPLLGGYGATEAYLPSKRIAIAVAVTFKPQAFDANGDYANGSDAIFRAIGKYLAPRQPPPTKK